MKVDADSREEGVKKMQDMMTQEALDQHMKEHHQPSETAPTLEESHAQIAANLKKAA